MNRRLYQHEGDGSVGDVMSACSFERLLQFVNKQLNLDGQMEAYDHLDRCDICRDAVYQLSRERDKALFTYRAYRAERYNNRSHIDEAAGLLSVYAG